MRGSPSRQQDLFEEKSTRRELAAEMRGKLRELLRKLLTEAAATATGIAATDSSVEEAGNDKDYC
jgi:hypothetical protein